MSRAKILLSSCERKALFRASQAVYNSNNAESGFADDLCEKLDDGGIWNPCFLEVQKIQSKDIGDDSVFGVFYILRWGQDHLSECEHTLRMIHERIKYVTERYSDAVKTPLPPFLTARDYYGPNWRDVRKSAISRDGGECVECGIGRKEHQERFDQDLHVHHIEPLREIGNYTEANKLENLQTLCFPCHRQLEKSKNEPM